MPSRRSFLSALAALFAAPVLPWGKARCTYLRVYTSINGEPFTAGPVKFGDETYYFTASAAYRIVPDGTQWK